MNINNPIHPPKKKKKKKTKVMITSSYLAFHLHKMVGHGTLKNNYISVELHRGAF